jgi:hypothetical protein
VFFGHGSPDSFPIYLDNRSVKSLRFAVYASVPPFREPWLEGVESLSVTGVVSLEPFALFLLLYYQSPRIRTSMNYS